MSTSYPKDISKLGPGIHFLILIPTTVSIPEAGHGYPAHTESYWNMELYPNEEEWKQEIARRRQSRYLNETFVPIIAQVPTVQTKVEVSIQGYKG